MTKRISVVIFHPANVFGGAERTILNLLAGIDSDRFSITLVASKLVLGQAKCDRFLDIDDLGLSNGFSGAFNVLRDAYQLVKVLQSVQSSVMLGMLHYGAIVSPFCRLISFGRIKVAASPRTPSVLGVLHHVGSGTFSAFLWHALIFCFCKFSNLIIVASRGLKDECVVRFGARADMVMVVPNSVEQNVCKINDPVADVSSIKKGDDAVFNLISVGRVSSEKDLVTLIYALDLLRNDGHNVRLTVFGSGPDLDSLQDLVMNLDLNSCVSFVGFVERPFHAFHDNVTFIHTALFEGFGNVILESMSAGIPVIATDCDFGPREIIDSGVNGILVSPRDASCLANAILSVATDFDLRKKFILEGYRTVKKFSLESMVNGYESAFNILDADVK